MLTLGNQRFKAMAIWPLIIARIPKDTLGPAIINHERIHFRQQLEMLFFPFFIWYFIEFLLHYIRTRDKHAAYLSISFEKEAYANEDSQDYLQDRKPFAWLKYFRHATPV